MTHAQPRRHQTRTASLLALFVVLSAACTPALNWRVVEPTAGLQILLPCKPHQRKEPVSLGDARTELSMLGCRAQGMDFTHSMLRIPEGLAPATVLAHWEVASLAPLGSLVSAPSSVSLKPSLAATGDAASAPKLARALRIQTRSGLQVHLIWWQQGPLAHQLALYAPQNEKAFDAALDAWVSGIQVQHPTPSNPPQPTHSKP